MDETLKTTVANVACLQNAVSRLIEGLLRKGITDEAVQEARAWLNEVKW